MGKLKINDKPVGEMTDDEIDLMLFRSGDFHSPQTVVILRHILRIVDAHYGELRGNQIHEILAQRAVIVRRRRVYRLLQLLRARGLLPTDAVKNYALEARERAREREARRRAEAREARKRLLEWMKTMPPEDVAPLRPLADALARVAEEH